MIVKLKEKEVSVALSIGESLEEAVKLVGPELVHKLYVESAERLGAAVVKRYMRKDWKAARIEKELAKWTPASVVAKIVDPVAKMQKAFEKLSKEEKALFKAAM